MFLKLELKNSKSKDAKWYILALFETIFKKLELPRKV